jgi:hypothetical protein
LLQAARPECVLPRQALILSCAAVFGCSAPPGSELDTDFDGPPPFSGPLGSAGAGGSGNPLPSGSGGTGLGQSPTENTRDPNLPVNNTGGTGTGGAGNPVVGLPEPPGEAFFFDDFEAGAPGTQPAAWDSWINYSVEAGNTLDGAQFALLDNQDCARGNQCVHFHAEGATQPAMLTMPLPANLSRVYIRAFVKTTKQVGNQVPDQQSNHETMIGLRGDARLAKLQPLPGQRSVDGRRRPQLISGRLQLSRWLQQRRASPAVDLELVAADASSALQVRVRGRRACGDVHQQRAEQNKGAEPSSVVGRVRRPPRRGPIATP